MPTAIQKKPPSALNLLEREVDKQVSKFLVERGWRRIRFQRTVIPGMFQTGEPGIPDCQYVRYLDRSGLAVVIWVETKRTRGGKVGQDQIDWRNREKERGAVVLKVNDAEELRREYERRFTWLHQPPWNAKVPQPVGHQTSIELEEEF